MEERKERRRNVKQEKRIESSFASERDKDDHMEICAHKTEKNRHRDIYKIGKNRHGYIGRVCVCVCVKQRGK